MTVIDSWSERTGIINWRGSEFTFINQEAKINYISCLAGCLCTQQRLKRLETFMKARNKRIGISKAHMMHVPVSRYKNVSFHFHTKLNPSHSQMPGGR